MRKIVFSAGALVALVTFAGAVVYDDLKVIRAIVPENWNLTGRPLWQLAEDDSGVLAADTRSQTEQTSDVLDEFTTEPSGFSVIIK